MEDASHSVAHFMAVGAEKRLEDYHFLRNTYETITSQEIQLNRILRMLGEDEICLSWRLDLSPVGRARSRSPHDFDRWANSLVLKGSIAYERLRELEQDTSRSAKPVTIPTVSRRVQEIRERRRQRSEQRDLPSESTVGARSTSSTSRLQALAEYETALAESSTKRQRQTEQDRSSNLRSDELEGPERKRERFTTASTDENRSYGRSKQYDDESTKRSTRKTSIEDDQGKRAGKDRENGSDQLRKSSMGGKPDKTGDIELISFTVRYQIIPSSSNEEGDEGHPSVRLLCRWASPSSSSAIEYFTIERQSGDNQWSPIGGQIDKLENQTKLDIALSNDENNGGINANVPYYFRLKAHLQNGQTFTSKATDGILIDLSREEKIIKPDVEILSPTSVQLTWNDTTNEANETEDATIEDKSNQLYDIEKKEEEQPEWEKITEVPLAQQSARIDSLTDAAQCQFRLIPTLPEPEQITTSSAEQMDISSEQDVESDEPVTPKTTKTSAASTKQTESDESNTLSAKNLVGSPKKQIDSDESAKLDKANFIASSEEQVDSDEIDTTDTKKPVASSKKQDESNARNARGSVASPDEQVDSDEIDTTDTKKPVASSKKQDESDARHARGSVASPDEQVDSDEIDTTDTKKPVVPSKKQDESDARKARGSVASSDEQVDSDEIDTTDTKKPVAPSKKQDESNARNARGSIASSLDEQAESDELDTTDTKTSVAPSKKQAESDKSSTSNAKNVPSSSDNEIEAEETEEAENEEEKEEDDAEVVTVSNVNEWMNSLQVAPTSSTTVDVDISEEGFDKFDRYKVEYTTSDRPDRWKQVSDITSDDPHLTIDSLKQGTDYKFRFTPVASDTISAMDGTNSSQFSLVLDVRMPSTRKGRFASDDKETPAATPPQFSIQQVDPTTVLIEAVVPDDKPARFEDTYDVYSKKDTEDADEDEDWTKVGTIDKKHLSTTVEDLEENTAYAFKIDNVTSPSADEESRTVQEFKLDTTPAKKYDPSLFLEKIERSLENVVNGVMQAAAGHQAIEEPVNQSLNEVIKEVFRDESLPNEQFGFDTLALTNDLQVYRGPKQMLIKDLEVDETVDLSKHYGEIIIHNYRTSQQSVIVREENGNTRVNNIDGDVIIRNVVSDVILKNEQTHHQLAMNIVGQAFLKGVQGSLIASKFKGIIVVKNVYKP